MTHQHLSPISWHDPSLLHGTLTSSSTFTSCAFTSHWWMRHKAQMFKCCLLVLVTIDLMLWKRGHLQKPWKNVFYVVQHTTLHIYLSSFLDRWSLSGSCGGCWSLFQLHQGDTSLNESPAHPSHGPFWAFGGTVPCSRVCWQCSEGVSAPFLLAEHLTCLDISYFCFWNINPHPLCLLIASSLCFYHCKSLFHSSIIVCHFAVI